MLRAFLALAPETAQPSPNGRTVRARGDRYDVPALLRGASVGFRERVKPWGTIYELESCLTSNDHNDGAAIFRFASGAVAYKCFHNRCAGKGWHDVKHRLGIRTNAGAASTDRRQRTQGEQQEAQSNSDTTQPLRFMTARQFAHETPTATEFVIPPWVPVGGIAKIDGAAKNAGKTTLMTRMIAAILDGADFLGQPTKQGRPFS